MNQETLTYCKNHLRTKSKRVYRKSLKAIVKSKYATIATIETTTHYAKEIRLQAKVFKKNIITNQINKYDYEKIRNN